MKINLIESEKDAIFIHLIFIITCIVILSIPALTIGIKLFILVIIYNLIIPLVGILRKNKEWLNIWLFAFILSIFQIFPDWFLSAELKILVFPEDGLFKIGTVSGYMLFLWSIPFFIIIFIGKRIQESYSGQFAYIAITFFSLLIFGISELTVWMIGSWYAQNVTLLGHAAIYIIVPEIILGLSSFYVYTISKEKKFLLKIPFAFLVMLLYLGCAVFFYFLIEKILFS